MRNKHTKWDENSYFALQKTCKEKISCEFCEKTFNNRYDSIIHNKHHIIIPLLKQKPYQCPECLRCFESKDYLVNHSAEHNVTNVKTSTDSDDVIIVDDDVEVNNGDVKWSLDINKRVTSHETDDSKRINEEYILPDIYYDVKISTKNGVANNMTAMGLTKNKENTFNDRKADDNVGVLRNDFRNDECAYNGDIDVETIDGFDENFISVHYDKLIVVGTFQCQYCWQFFNTRLKLIQHQTSHLTFRKTRVSVCMVCDRYIAGTLNLRKHMRTKHPDEVEKSRTSLKKCNLCKLKYSNYKRHLLNYHSVLFSGSAVSYGNTEFHCLKQPSETAGNILTVCAICTSFLKSTGKIYTLIGVLTQFGFRQECCKCKKSFFEINLVQSAGKAHVTFANRFKFEEEVRKRKRLSNENRLRNIRTRLRKINKMNRICMFV